MYIFGWSNIDIPGYKVCNKQRKYISNALNLSTSVQTVLYHTMDLNMMFFAINGLSCECAKWVSATKTSLQFQFKVCNKQRKYISNALNLSTSVQTVLYHTMDLNMMFFAINGLSCECAKWVSATKTSLQFQFPPPPPPPPPHRTRRHNGKLLLVFFNGRYVTLCKRYINPIQNWVDLASHATNIYSSDVLSVSISSTNIHPTPESMTYDHWL